jgi:hypothetical protein
MRWWAVRLGVILAVGLGASVVFAQDATEPALKGALIFNFARFTSWPEDVLPPNAAIVACVVGNNGVSQALERTVKDRVLAGHHITVSHPDAKQSMRTCHVLYISDTDPTQMSRMIAEVRGTPVLTIVDVENARNAGNGIARFFVENGRNRFELDRGLAKRGRLQLSSKLLLLASRVLDEPGVAR